MAHKGPEFPKPSGSPQFTAPWFRWFLPLLTLPEGHPMRWEGHLLLMTEEFFTPELTHLLVLIPKGNFKTTWEGALAVWHLLTVPAPRAFCGAANIGQAKELFDFAAHFVDSEPEIQSWPWGKTSGLFTRSSTNEIRTNAAASRAAFRVLAQDDSKIGGKKQGINSTLSLADELHAWANRNLFTDLLSGGFKRREAARYQDDPLWHALGKAATITTETHDEGSVLAEELTKFLGDPKKGLAPKGTVETSLRVLPDGSVERHPDGRLTIARYDDGANVLLRWANNEDDDTEDDAVVKLANPASVASVASIKSARNTLTPWEFLRYRCNIRTLGFESWLPAGAWDTLKMATVPVVAHQTWEGATTTGARMDEDDATSPPLLRDETDDHGNVTRAALTDEFRDYVASLYPSGTTIVGALDMARYRDTAAIVVIARTADGRKVPRTLVWRSGGHDNPIRYEWVEAAILALHDTYDLQAFGKDPKYGDQLGERMSDAGVMMEEFPQSPERMGRADTELRAEILRAEFAHDGDPILSAHIMAGKARDVGPLLLMVDTQTGASPPPIDACKAFSMANALEKTLEDGEPLGGWG